jgi:hypothetical protein
MKTGTAHLPLHSGKAPSWLFQRMVRLSREIVTLLVYEFGTRELLARLADPYWFQAFGCVLGFDWHSSGVTTTVCGAVKEGLRGREQELGIIVAGGKGNASRKTPEEIRRGAELITPAADVEQLVYASKMAAKVDNTAVQDGYQLYHHVLLYDREGRWTVVQQGMHDANGWARRYHWLSDGLQSFINEPHAAVCSNARGQITLNMVAEEADASRRTAAVLAGERPEKLLREVELASSTLLMPSKHPVSLSDVNPRYLQKVLLKTYERQPENFQQLLEIEGVGPMTVRALAMIADLLYGAPASTRDPARFSFAHGGKDGYPYPVDRKQYDRSVEVMKNAVERSKLGDRVIADALKRLQRFYEM